MGPSLENQILWLGFLQHSSYSRASVPGPLPLVERLRWSLVPAAVLVCGVTLGCSVNSSTFISLSVKLK